MDIQYLGANSVKITTKRSVIITDPKSDIAEIKTDLKKATHTLATQSGFEAKSVPEGCFVVNGPGEYEFSDNSVKGVAVQPHSGASGDISATMYRISIGDITVLITGHVAQKSAESNLEDIGMIDVLVIPVGGSGYTLDATGAAALVRAIEPKIVVPVHYSDGTVYEVPQQELELFTKELGAPVEEVTDKYKVKTLPEQLTVQPLSRV